MAALDQLTSLASLLGTVQGRSQTSKTSGGTTTQQTNVSDQGVSELINQILSNSSNGVQSIGRSARNTGLYNSTSEDLLLQNLYATAANQAELARSPTTSTTSGTTTTTNAAGTGIGTLAATVGGAALLNSALNSDIGQNLIGSIFGGGLGTNKKTTEADNTIGSIASSLDLSNVFNAAPTAGSQNISIPDTKMFNFGLDLDSGNSSGGVSYSGGSGSGGLMQLASTALSGLVGSSLGSSGGGSVICTALMKRGLLDKELYNKGSQYLLTLPKETVLGYHSWALGVAEKISNGHKGWIKVCLPFATSRTKLLATSGKVTDHIKHPLGTLTKFVGEPVCWVIGKYLLKSRTNSQAA